MSDGHLYVLNKRKSDKDTHHIHKVQQGGNDGVKDIAPVQYSGEVNENDNLGENGNPNDSKEHRSSHGKDEQAWIRFGQGVYKPTYKI